MCKGLNLTKKSEILSKSAISKALVDDIVAVHHKVLLQEISQHQSSANWSGS